MAIGDAAAAKGLAVFASTQDLRLGYQNDNQRGDDIAATMVRLDKVESNAKTPQTIQIGTPIARTVANGATQTVTSSVAVAAATYARNIRVDWSALVTAVPNGNTYVDFYLQRTVGGTTTQIQGRRVYGTGTVSGTFTESLAANASPSYVVVASPSNGSAAVTDDARYTQLRVISTTIA